MIRVFLYRFQCRLLVSNVIPTTIVLMEFLHIPHRNIAIFSCPACRRFVRMMNDYIVYRCFDALCFYFGGSGIPLVAQHNIGLLRQHDYQYDYLTKRDSKRKWFKTYFICGFFVSSCCRLTIVANAPRSIWIAHCTCVQRRKY